MLWRESNEAITGMNGINLGTPALQLGRLRWRGCTNDKGNVVNAASVDDDFVAIEILVANHVAIMLYFCQANMRLA